MVMLVKSFKQNRVLLNHFGFSIECSAAIQTCIMEWYQIHALLRFQFYYMSRIIFMWIGDSFGMTCKPFIRNPRGRHTMLVNTNRLHANLIESMCDWIENETPPPPTNVGKNPWHLTECPKCSSEQLKQRKFQSTNAINANNMQHRNSPLVRRGSRARRRKRGTERERKRKAKIWQNISDWRLCTYGAYLILLGTIVKELKLKQQLAYPVCLSVSLHRSVVFFCCVFSSCATSPPLLLHGADSNSDALCHSYVPTFQSIHYSVFTLFLQVNLQIDSFWCGVHARNSIPNTKYVVESFSR